MFPVDMNKGKEINNEKEGPQDRTLGHPYCDGSNGRSERLETNELSAVREVGVEPAEGEVSDAEMRQSVQKDGVGGSVERCTEV